MDFNNHLLLLQKLKEGEDPLGIPLFHATFWIQVHSLPSGTYTEAMAKQFGNFVWVFRDYDAKAIEQAFEIICVFVWNWMCGSL